MQYLRNYENILLHCFLVKLKYDIDKNTIIIHNIVDDFDKNILYIYFKNYNYIDIKT